jgi:PIN domain nuclease of toxin-antitoxin system
MIALDASALLAFLFREPGHEIVTEAINDACISTVNLSETLGRFARDGHDPEPIAVRLADSPLEIVPFSSTQAILCARLLPLSRDLGLSLGDRACLAVAMERGITAMTADAAWQEIKVAVEIALIR